MTNWKTKRSDSAGTETLALKRVVFWDPEEPTATRPLAINVLGDNLYFPTVDLTKNVCELVDFYGDIAATYDYAPFGAVSAGTPSGAAAPANPFQFSSEFYDSELGLVYYNYRHYSPTDGRWLSRDPIEEQGGLNLYGIYKNNFLEKSDYLGWVAPNAEISIIIRDLIKIINETRVDNKKAHNYCERYSRNSDAVCCRNGVEEKDTYVSKAKKMCHDFVDMYSRAGKVIEPVECVAKCLSDAEDESMLISCCDDRNSLRLTNHVKCYATCGFFLTDMLYEIGTPPGGWDMGFNEMFPDLIKSIGKRIF
ncbi:MAG: RHS repeat domain-containing protein [Candidatus Spyradosoma sp.]